MNPQKNEYSTRQKVGLFAGFPLFVIMIFLPPPSGLSAPGWFVLASALLMAILWISECIPIPVTALLPLLLFPFFKVSPFGAVASNYANSNIFLFMGGFFIAMAMQRWGLHRRIALYLIYFIGSSPRRIVLGFMIATAFLSMWISNTATTMMMYPIGLAIILRILLLFVLLQVIDYFQDPLFKLDIPYIHGSFNLYSLIVILGGGFIIYTAVKEIWHMISLEEHESTEEKKSKPVGQVIAMIILMNLVFSFDSILSAIALTKVIWVMATAIVIGGILMIWLADKISDFLQNYVLNL